MEHLLQFSSEYIFSPNSIVSASEVNPNALFIKGPFENIPENDFNDPYEEGIDWDADSGPKEFKTIISCAGRVSYGLNKNQILPDDLFTLAELGGWQEEDNCYQEYISGGADILPDYTCLKLSNCILNVLGKTDCDFQANNRVIVREIVWRSVFILRGGPTLFPW